MKLAFSTNAFRKHSIEQTIGILASIGYDGVEIMCDVPHAWPPETDAVKVASIREALRNHRMGVSNLNAFMMCAIGDFHHPSWIEEEVAERRKRVDHTVACVELAAQLGAATISTEPGGPLGGMDRRRALEIFHSGIAEAGRTAGQRGVKILVEPEPDLLIETSLQFREFYEKADPRTVGLNFDVGHFYCVGEDPAGLAREFGPLISHVHLEDIAADRKHFHLPPGKGAIDYDALFAALRDIGYRGWITVELYPFQDDAPRIAEEALAFLRQRYG